MSVKAKVYQRASLFFDDPNKMNYCIILHV